MAWDPPKMPPPPSIPPWVDRKMTVAANGITYQQFIAAGWTDSQLVEQGYMESPNMPSAAIPPLAEPARSLDKIHKDLLARTEDARIANESAANCRDKLREVRDEYNAACSYYVNEANRELAS